MNKLFLIISACFVLFSFKTDNPKLWEVKQKGNIISIDKLGKIYQVTNKAVLKYDNNGEKLVNYSVLNNGNITSIDTRNALQTLLFFKDQQEAILLDNMLGESNSINFTRFFEWIDLICFSNRDNAFWLYSINNQELIKTDKNLNIISRYPNLAQVLSLDLHPTQLFEVNETVYLFDKQNGLILFDIFGNYKKTIALNKADKVVVSNNVVYYTSENSILYYNLTSFSKGAIFESVSSIVDFQIYKSQVYIQTNEALTAYNIISN